MSLEFGNLDQIEFVRRHERIFNGIEAIHKINWKYCIHIGHSGPTSRPKFKYVEWNEGPTAVVDHIHCPQCRRIHVLLIEFTQAHNLYEQLIFIDKSTEDGFHCWNCKTEFEVEDRAVFVKSNQG